MKEGFTIKEQSKAHFITATVVDWIDVFSKKTFPCHKEIKNTTLIVFLIILSTK